MQNATLNETAESLARPTYMSVARSFLKIDHTQNTPSLIESVGRHKLHTQVIMEHYYSVHKYGKLTMAFLLYCYHLCLIKHPNTKQMWNTLWCPLF